MGEVSPLLFALVVIIALVYDFANGLNDAANSIATVVSTRVLRPETAILMAASLNTLGGLVGLEVARTVGKGIVNPEELTLGAVLAGALAGALWVLLVTRFGMPISVTHSLVAGVLGAGLAVAGVEAIAWGKFIPVLISVAAAPLLGFGLGLVLRVAIAWAFRHSSHASVNTLFGRLQILSAAYMSFSHGRNDAQNARGILMLALVLYTGQAGYWDSPPWWIYIVPALVMGLGTAYGGWRVIRTVGMRVTALRPVDGFAAETGGATVIELASALAIPVSTTHCITGAVMGVGSTRRLSAVRWGVARHIVAAWILTFPVVIATGWVLAKLITPLL